MVKVILVLLVVIMAAVKAPEIPRTTDEAVSVLNLPSIIAVLDDSIMGYLLN